MYSFLNFADQSLIGPTTLANIILKVQKISVNEVSWRNKNDESTDLFQCRKILLSLRAQFGHQQPIWSRGVATEKGQCRNTYWYLLHFSESTFTFVIKLCILIKIIQCHCLDPTFLQNGTTDFDETLHVAWICLPEGFSNSGRAGGRFSLASNQYIVCFFAKISWK